MPSPSLVRIARRSKFLLPIAGIALAIFPRSTLAQTDRSPLIKVESHEVIVPIQVVQQNKSTGVVPGSNGEAQLGWVLHYKEVTGLSAKSVHIFDDGVEAKIQHFSVEKGEAWEVRDNIGDHVNYSCTPRGIWLGPDITNKTGTLHDSSLHTYLVTYVPLPSPAGSCHRISIKVDRRHSTVFAPLQYCNTDDPLSDPLKQTELGNKLFAYSDSKVSGDLPLALEVVPFLGPSTSTPRINLSAELPANQLRRHWDGIFLTTSIAILGLVFDRKGTLVTRFSDAACVPSGKVYDGPLPPPASFLEFYEQAVIPSGYETQVNLNPGDYRLEFLLTDGEKIGRTTASLTVDDFSSSALSISGIALCKRYHKPAPDEKGPTRAPQYVPLMFNGQEFTPTGETRFKKGEQQMTYVEIYGSELRAPSAPKLFMEMKVFDKKTGELKIGTGVRPVESPMRRDYPAIPVVWEMEVAKLPAGSYRLEAQVSDSAGHKTPWRTASFSVE